MLKVGQTLNYRYQKTTGSFATEGIYWNGVHNMLVMSPLMPAYNSDGSYYVFEDRVADSYVWDTANGAAKNPIAYMDYTSNQNVSKSHYLQASVYAVLQPIERLNIKSQFGYMMSASSYRSYMPEYDLDATAKREMDQVSQSMSLSNRWSWETRPVTHSISMSIRLTPLWEALWRSGATVSLSAQAMWIPISETLSMLIFQMCPLHLHQCRASADHLPRRTP